MTIMLEFLYSFAVVFIDCEMGQRVNLAFAKCSEIVEQFDWYLFPTEIQRMLPLILNITQQPFEIVCFGSAAGDRETFKSVCVTLTFLCTMIELNSMNFCQVIKTAYSYLTVLRQYFN